MGLIVVAPSEEEVGEGSWRTAGGDVRGDAGVARMVGGAVIIVDSRGKEEEGGGRREEDGTGSRRGSLAELSTRLCVQHVYRTVLSLSLSSPVPSSS